MLSRQLERYRDVTRVWAQQRVAVKFIAARKERELSECTAKIAALLSEREEVEKQFSIVYNKVTSVLSDQLQEVETMVATRKAALEESLEEERQMAETIVDVETENDSLRRSLDATVTQLSTMRAHAKHAQGEPAAPERKDVQRKPDLFTKRTEALQAHIASAEKALSCERSRSAKLEAFISQVAASDGDFMVDARLRREAGALISAAARVRAEQGASSRGRLRSKSPFKGRVCAACDEEAWLQWKHPRSCSPDRCPSVEREERSAQSGVSRDRANEDYCSQAERLRWFAQTAGGWDRNVSISG